MRNFPPRKNPRTEFPPPLYQHAYLLRFYGNPRSTTTAGVSLSPAGPGGAGGACTNAMISVLQQKPQITIIELLEEVFTLSPRPGAKPLNVLSPGEDCGPQRQ